MFRLIYLHINSEPLPLLTALLVPQTPFMALASGDHIEEVLRHTRNPIEGTFGVLPHKKMPSCAKIGGGEDVELEDHSHPNTAGTPFYIHEIHSSGQVVEQGAVWHEL